MRLWLCACVPLLSLLAVSVVQAQPWMPTNLPSGQLKNWYDAADFSTFWQDAGATTPVTTNGQMVLCWKDKSGNGNDIKSANGPTYTTGVMNSRPLLRFADNSFAQQADKSPVPGTYYSSKDFEWEPSLPFNPHPELEVMEIAPGIFVFEDTAIPDTPEQAEARKRRREADVLAKAIAADPVLAKAAQEAAAKAQAKAWGRNRQRFLPTLHQPLTFRDGLPATAWCIVEGHRLLVAETLAEKQAEAESRRLQAEQWAKDTGNPLKVPLEDGRAAYLEAVLDGLPVYKGTFNLNAARTIATDRVRPGGDTGLNLTGTNTLMMSWDAVVGQNYQVKYRNSVEGPGWTNIGGVVNAARTNVSVTLPYDAQQPHWFFRVIEVP